jgi:hypothetical protein
LPHKKYEIHLAKSAELYANLAYINTEISEFVIGGVVPEFEMGERIYLDNLKDENGNYILTVDVEEYGVCEVACSLFLRFGYNGSIPSD